MVAVAVSTQAASGSASAQSGPARGADLRPVSSIMILIYKSKSSGMYSPGHLVRYRKIRILDE